jgi:hypothetical protein
VKNTGSGVRLQADDEEAVSMLLLAVCAAAVGLLALVLASALVVTGSNQRLSDLSIAGLAGLARHRTAQQQQIAMTGRMDSGYRRIL